MKWNEVPKFTEYELVNPICFGFVSYVDFIENEIKEYNLNMNPDFQRGHVWTEIQQSKYVEFILKGGKSGRDFYFNWNPDTNDYVCVDGVQRTTALQNFVYNKLKAFGQFFDEFSFTKYIAAYNPLPEYRVNVYRNSLKTKREILQWYVDMNAGGTPHTNEEIERIKKMIENL
jgi:hypothetical protein